MSNNILTIPFIQVPIEFVAWENDAAGRSNCAFILAQLIHIHKLKDTMNIVESTDGFMRLTTDKILELMYYSIRSVNLRKCLRSLEDEGLIEKLYVNNRFQYIKVNTNAINNLYENYKNYRLNNNDRIFFTVYYPCFAYQQDNRGGTNVSYMLSMFMQLYQAHKFPEDHMTLNYLSKGMSNIFSEIQLTYMLNKLQKDKLISITNTTKKKCYSYVNERRVFYNDENIAKLIEKYTVINEPINYIGGNVDEDLIKVREENKTVCNLTKKVDIEEVIDTCNTSKKSEYHSYPTYEDFGW